MKKISSATTQYQASKLAFSVRRLMTEMPTLVFWVFFILLAILSSKDYWFHITKFISYPLTDWAISYSGGFVRRGLSGEIILWICEKTSASFVLVTAILSVFCNLIFTASVAALVYPLRNNNWAWLLIYGPGCFAAGMSTREMYGHKDVLLLMLAGVIFFGAAQFAGRLRTVWVLTCLALTIPLVLAHEGFIIFVPILFVALSSLKLTRPVIGVTLLIVIGLAAASLASIKFSGTIDQRDAMIAAFYNTTPIQYSLRAFDQSAAFWFVGQSLSDTFSFAASPNKAGLGQLPAALLLCFGPLIVAIRMLHVRQVFADPKGKVCAALIILSCILLAILMTFAIDWTRFLIDMSMLIVLAVIMRIRLIDGTVLSSLPGARRSEQNASLRFTIMCTLTAAYFLLKPGKVAPDVIHFGTKGVLAVILIALIAHYQPSLTHVLQDKEK